MAWIFGNFAAGIAKAPPRSFLSLFARSVQAARFCGLAFQRLPTFVGLGKFPLYLLQTRVELTDLLG